MPAEKYNEVQFTSNTSVMVTDNDVSRANVQIGVTDLSACEITEVKQV